MKGLGIEDVDWLVPHQANQRILDHFAQECNFPAEKIYSGKELIDGLKINVSPENALQLEISLIAHAL